MASTKKKEDVSKRFFELCEGLKIGEMATTEYFRLGDVMSAIELMDPKMDVGVGTHETKNLDTAIRKGLYRDDFPMHLAIMDGTLAMIVAWLEGSSLGSTVWTNIMLGEEKYIDNPTLGPFVKGVNLLVRNMYSLINSVGNLEELPEDFNPHMIFATYRWENRLRVITDMRNQVFELTNIGRIWEKKSLSDYAATICHAVSLRFELIICFLEIFAHLVPPEIEDPLFPHKVHLGNIIVNERELDRVNNSENTVQNSNKVEGGTEENTEEEGTVKSDGTQQFQCSEDDFGEEEDDDTQFKPNFSVAVKLSERLIHAATQISNTIQYGRKAPDGVDGDFTWLPAFDNKACVRMIPACFPRSVQIKSRAEAADWFVRCAYRIHDLCMTTPNTVRDLSTLFYFARTFNLNACVLTRSLLQICMFPTDNHLCGSPNVTVADPIEVSLKTGFMPQVLRTGSPVALDRESNDLYICFLNYMTKLAISVYSSFGCNLSRQRDRLEMAIEELGAIQYHAGRLENRTDEVMLQSGLVNEREENPSFHSVSTFVFHNLLAIIHHYFELGFRMELYVPYEFTYMYWFMGNVESKWMLTTMERSHEIQLVALRGMEKDAESEKRKLTGDQAQISAILHKRLIANQFAMVNQYAMSQICAGVMKATVVMIRKGYIKMPPGGDDTEKLRFERRMEQFENLGPPLHVSYEEYKNESQIDAYYAMEFEPLIDEATRNFQLALHNLMALDNKQEKNRETLQLVQAAKSNLLACKLLKMDLNPPAKDTTAKAAKPAGKKMIVWQFNDDYPLWPVLKLVVV